jgi:hypothetical protein
MVSLGHWRREADAEGTRRISEKHWSDRFNVE